MRREETILNLSRYIQFSSVQSLSRVRLFATPWIAAHQASLSITNSWSSLKLTSIELVMPSSHLILCHPLFLLPPIPLSIRVFSNESTLCMRWPKDWNFSFSIIPSKEHPGLISFGMDWLDLLAVQGTLKSLLQHHSSKASILQHSAFFTVQLSHPYMTIGKTIALTRRTFVGKVTFLLLNMLSRLVITFLPRSRYLGIKKKKKKSKESSGKSELRAQIYGLSRATSSSLGATSPDTPVTVGQKWAIPIVSRLNPHPENNKHDKMIAVSIHWLLVVLLCCNRRLEAQEKRTIMDHRIRPDLIPGSPTSFYLVWPGHLN